MTQIQVQKREILGKKVKSLRKQGLIPAELYGRDFKNIHLAVSVKDFSKVLKEAGESSVIQLSFDGEKKESVNVLIHDVAKNPTTDEFLNVDFYQVRMDEKITTSVPLKFTGEAPAIKEKNGILIKAIQEIEIETLPANLPQFLEVDLGKLNDIGVSFYVKDLKVNKEIKFLIEPETVIATITEAEKEEEAPKAASVEDVEIVGKKEKEEKGEESKK